MARNGHSVVVELSVKGFRRRHFGRIPPDKATAVDQINIFLRVRAVDDRIVDLSLKRFRGHIRNSRNSSVPFLFVPSSMNALRNAFLKNGVQRSLVDDSAAYVEVEVGKRTLRRKKRGR